MGDFEVSPRLRKFRPVGLQLRVSWGVREGFDNQGPGTLTDLQEKLALQPPKGER